MAPSRNPGNALGRTAQRGPDFSSYRIANRSSRVVGGYRGTPAQTRRNAEELATSFNERASSNRSVWSPRLQSGRKPAAGKVKAKATARAAR